MQAERPVQSEGFLSRTGGERCLETPPRKAEVPVAFQHLQLHVAAEDRRSVMQRELGYTKAGGP